MADTPSFCPLSHEGLLAVRGADASKFLQGQLTCNLNYLDSNTSSLGARCTIKGRMLSSFRIVPDGDGFILAMAADLLEAQLAELKKYAVFSKSTLTDETAAWVRFGLHNGESALSALGLTLAEPSGSMARTEHLLAIRLSESRSELWTLASEAPTLHQQLRSQLSETALNSWLLGQVREGVGQVFGPSRELFIPQMLNLQALGGVSFKKGCYTGQEIVARMQYLGKLKRRMYRLSLTGTDIPAVASAIFSPVHSSAVGEVVLAASSDNGVELLAVLQEDAVSDNRLHLNAIDGAPLSLLELPYSLDSNRDIQR